VFNILDTIGDENLLGGFFAGSSWSNWRIVLKALHGLKMTPAERERFRQLADRDPPPGRVREAWLAIGRRGGKDSIASAIAVQAAVYGNYAAHVRPGERPIVLLLAATREQASGLFDYVAAYFDGRVPLLAPLVNKVNDRDGIIELSTGVDIAVMAANFRTIRNRTICLAVLNEICFWRDEQGGFSNPDAEIYSAVVPAMVTLRKAGAMLIGISSVHRKLGLMYDKWLDHHGKEDPDVLVIKAPSATFNPTITEADIAADMRLDPDKARAEWFSEWRTDIAAYIDRDLVEGMIDHGIRERPYDRNIPNYTAFSDESGGSGQDSSTLSICHRERDGTVVQDLLRIWRPPFLPVDVIAEKAQLVKSYGLAKVTGDRWARGLPENVYSPHGVRFELSPKPKSELYLDYISILNSRKMRFLDEPTQIAELCALERRTAWGGRDSIDHVRGGHDDAINATAGASVLASSRKVITISDELLQHSAVKDYWKRFSHSSPNRPSSEADLSHVIGRFRI
jgi:hypothetical protein